MIARVHITLGRDHTGTLSLVPDDGSPAVVIALDHWRSPAPDQYSATGTLTDNRVLRGLLAGWLGEVAK